MTDDTAHEQSSESGDVVDRLSKANVEPGATIEQVAGETEQGDGSHLVRGPDAVSVFNPHTNNGDQRPLEANEPQSDPWFAGEFDKIRAEGPEPLTLGTKPAAAVGTPVRAPRSSSENGPPDSGPQSPIP